MNQIAVLMGSAALTLTVGLSAATAQQCVRIAGVEDAGEQLTMDPAFMATDDDAMHMYGVYNRLVDLDGNMDVVPELAESWSASPDGKVWTFKLVQGVKFHDGRDFGAEDVVYTFRRLIDEAVGSRARGLLPFLTPENITAVDGHTVEFRTAEPIAVLPVLLANKFNLIVPEGATSEELRLKGTGTGPFMQKEFTPGTTKRVLTGNPDYWRAGLPKAECLEITAIPEEFARNAALKSGQVDLLLNVGPTSIVELRSDPGVKLLSAPAGSFYTFSMLVDSPPFDDVNVRKALKLVVDRAQLVDLITFGFGVPGNDNPVPPSWPSAYKSEAPARDVAEAKRLLAKAGYAEGLDIELYTSDVGPGILQMSEAFQQMAAEAGIRVELIRTPPDSYWDDVYMKHPFFVSSWTIRPPLEGLSYTYTYPADSGINETHWFRDDFNGVIKSARQEMDADKRAELLRTAQEMLAQEGGVIVPFHLQNIAASRAACDGFETHMQTTNLNYESIACTP